MLADVIAIGDRIIGDHDCLAVFIIGCNGRLACKPHSFVVGLDKLDGPLECCAQRVAKIAASLQETGRWFLCSCMCSIDCDALCICCVIFGQCRPFVFGKGDLIVKELGLLKLVESRRPTLSSASFHFESVAALVADRDGGRRCA